MAEATRSTLRHVDPAAVTPDRDDALALTDDPNAGPGREVAEREPDLREYLAPIEPDRQVTDWGRSERVEGVLDRTLIDFF